MVEFPAAAAMFTQPVRCNSNLSQNTHCTLVVKLPDSKTPKLGVEKSSTKSRLLKVMGVLNEFKRLCSCCACALSSCRECARCVAVFARADGREAIKI